MSDARFDPPKAAVADVPVEPPPRPVVIACWLLVLSLLLGFVSLGVDVSSVPTTETTFMLVGLVVIGLPLVALFAWLIAMLWRRRSWARWALLAFMVAGWLLLLLDDGSTEGRLPSAMIIDGITAIVEFIAMVLVFFGPGARWFKERPPQAPRTHSAAS